MRPALIERATSFCVSLAACQFLMQRAVVDREHDALPVAVPEGKLDQAGVKRQSCGATASRQIEQPQVRLCPILRVRPRHDGACTIRGQSRAAKRTRFPGLTRRALPIEPGELEVGVVDAVHQDVVGRSRKETAVPKGAHPLRDGHRIPGRAPAVSCQTAAP